MSQRRQLPVDDGQHPWLGRVKDQVVQPVVAMNQRDAAVVVGQPLWQPVDEEIHVGDRVGFGSPVLPGPARQLAGVVAGPGAVVAQPDLVDVELVQRCQHPDELVVDRSPFRIVGGFR